jgi:flagellar hook-length control protein FliK
MSDIATIAPAVPTSVAKPALEREIDANIRNVSGEFGAMMEELFKALSVGEAASSGESLPSSDAELPATEGEAALPATSNDVEGALPVTFTPPPTTPLPFAAAMPALKNDTLSTTEEPLPPQVESKGVARSPRGQTQESVKREFELPDDDVAGANYAEQPAIDEAVAIDATTASRSADELKSEAPSNVTALTTASRLRESPPLSLDTKLPVLQPQFGQMFNEQVTVLVEHGIKFAHLTLNPPELGPIDVRISFQQDEATIQFASHHGAVRDAVTDALPRLRDMLENSGVRLGEAGVFSQLPQREQASPFAPPTSASTTSTVIPDELPARNESVVYELRLVDAYV